MTAEKFKRKLTAILSADVKGYSRLMGTDEEATLRTLQEYKEVMASSIQHHRGRIVGTAGDSVLAEFASVVDAVQCGVEIQQVLRAKNALLPEDRRMDFRIGINLGDVIEEGDTIYGDGVNIAARLESMAEAGGICISESAYQQIKNKLPLRYDYLGEHEVKNIAEPVRVYRAQVEPEAASSKLSREKKPVGKRLSKAALAIIAVVVIAGAVILYQFVLRPSPSKTEVASKEKMALPLARCAFYCCAALCKHERGPKAGIPLRRDDRGNHHCPFQGTQAVCDRPKFDLHLQGKTGEGQAGK